MLKEAIGNKFEYSRLTPEEQQKRGILGRLVGTIADFKHPTRNGRLYSEELWDKVFKDPIMQEKIQTKTVLGELGHPDGRSETDIQKVAICLSEEPKKYADGTIKGVFDILDTPNGRILKTLCDYGCDIGISSRGEGDIIENWNGDSEVDPSTYNCECWDAVLLPAVKSARLKVVESLSPNGKTLKQALTEELSKSNTYGRKIQEETLKNLNIDYNASEKDSTDDKNKKEEDEEEAIDINKESTDDPAKETEDLAVASDKAKDFSDDLTESLKENKQLRNKIKELQEQLSVCYTKEKSKEVEISRLKNCIVALTEDSKSLKALKPKLDSLKEQLDQRDSRIKEQELKISRLTKNHSSSIEKYNSLTESLDSKEEQISELKSQNKDLRESLSQYKKESSENQRTLIERVEELKKDSSLKKCEFDSKIEKANSLVEKYQRVAKNAVDKLIESKAVMLGVNPNEIKSKLPANYSFKDIDNICEELQQYQVNLSKIPLAIKPNLDKGVKVSVKESIEPIKPKSRFDDTVDDSLLSLAGLKN